MRSTISTRHVPFYALLFLFLLGGTSEAVLKDVGPVDPAHGFPTWYRDNTVDSVPGFPYGLPLDICLSKTLSPHPLAAPDNGTMCNLLPVPGFDPNADIVFPTNFPDEAFWFAADTQVKIVDVIRARLVMAIEGAFGTGAPASGDQISFARLRIVISTPPGAAGTFTVYHPYGVNVFTDVPDNTVHAIFYTQDIGISTGGIFTGALKGTIGPYLRWDVLTPEEQVIYGSAGLPLTVGGERYLGDPNILHTITGSPVGTNLFRVDGPPGSNLDGQGNPFVETNLFSITGKIRTEPIPSALTVRRATYARDDATTQIDVFAATDPLSNTGVASALRISGVGFDNTDMAMDGAGNAFASIRLTNPVALPDNVTVTNLSENAASVPAPSVSQPLVDEVIATQADYDPIGRTLQVHAYSRDRLGLPALSIGGIPFDPFGLVTFSIPTVPPKDVEVFSEAGGSGVKAMSVVVPPGGGGP